MQTQKPVVKMEDWAVVSSVMSGGYEEAKPGNLLLGKVFGHPRMADGAFVFSSPILSLDLNSGMVETRNTAYELGTPNSAYINRAHSHGQQQGAEVAA